jgi:hypothetical protein
MYRKQGDRPFYKDQEPPPKPDPGLSDEDVDRIQLKFALRQQRWASLMEATKYLGIAVLVVGMLVLFVANIQDEVANEAKCKKLGGIYVQRAKGTYVCMRGERIIID